MLVVTAQEMREIDRLTSERYGVPSLTLMERAGEGIAQAILERFEEAVRAGVLIVAGKGNNGGDGFVVARLLKEKKVSCEVVLLAPESELSGDAAVNMRAYIEQRGKVFSVGNNLEALAQRMHGKGLLVDAILGTGMKDEVKGLYAEAIELMNASGLPIAAVDTPSGLHSDTGFPLGAAVQAEMTVSLGCPKLGQVIYPGLNYVGDLVIADIGLEPRAIQAVAPRTELLEAADIGWLVPRRKPDSHKGNYGHLLVLAGARGKTGAAILACRAAMRTGAGLVTLAAPRSLNEILAGSLIEVMTELLGEDAVGGLEAPTDEEWRRLLERKDALLFGPGIGVSEATQSALIWLLKNLSVPWVIDADGLNNLALEKHRLRYAKVPPILTPHPGEMARLIEQSSAVVNQNRIGVARAFATENCCHVVLKGARTVIATADGRVFINPTGNPGMASGGMGDVLAGMLAALLGQGFSPEGAMKLGVFLHGFTGDRAAKEKGPIGLIASDVIEGLPSAMRDLSTLTV